MVFSVSADAPKVFSLVTGVIEEAFFFTEQIKAITKHSGTFKHPFILATKQDQHLYDVSAFTELTLHPSAL